MPIIGDAKKTVTPGTFALLIGTHLHMKHYYCVLCYSIGGACDNIMLISLIV